MWVSYNFKTTLDYSSLYRSIYFWCQETTLQKIFPIEKLILVWNKQSNSNKFVLRTTHPTQKKKCRKFYTHHLIKPPIQPEVRENLWSPKAQWSCPPCFWGGEDSIFVHPYFRPHKISDACQILDPCYKSIDSCHID